MFSKLIHKSSLIIPTWCVFGFIGFVGYRLQEGETMRGNRGIMRMMADALNTFADAIGPVQAGYSIMVLALFCGIYAAIWIWREPMI